MNDRIAGFTSTAVAASIATERERFRRAHPKSAALAERAGKHWLQGVPLHWMSDWGTPFPVFVAAARGAEIRDVDGNLYADFCLGDSGAMFGHAPAAVVAALKTQADRGLTAMLPSEDAVVAGELLARLFGLPCWQMTLSASDANRAVLRWARAVTGRKAVLVFDGCYHGAVDDAFVQLDGTPARGRPGLVGQAADLALHSRCVEFNDLAALDAALRTREIACVLAEPVMTNCGMVLPDPGYHEELRRLTRRHGTLLAIDETHTLSCGYGGFTRGAQLHPDFLVAGKAIAGGFPCAVYGFGDELHTRLRGVLAGKPAGHSGIGTTLAGSALAAAALRANLEQVMTVANYARMIAGAERLEEGLERLIVDENLPWYVSRVGARLEVGFVRTPPRTGRAARAAQPPLLPAAIRLYLLNRGMVITPFHSMMLSSPDTTPAQIDRLAASWAECVTELLAGRRQRSSTNSAEQ